MICPPGFLLFYRIVHIKQLCEIMNGVVEVEGALEEVKTEQGEDKTAEGVLAITYTTT